MGTFGISMVRRCLNEARISADQTASGRLSYAYKAEGRKESAYVRVFA